MLASTMACSFAATGDIIALSPPLILEKAHIDEMFGKIGDLLKAIS